MMNEEKFAAVMGILVPQIIGKIAAVHDYDELSATNQFYASQVYSLLEQEDTKLWHLSPLTLFHMFEEEVQTGQFELPEET